MKYYLQARLYAIVAFNGDEFNFIWSCCKKHYDATVKTSIEVGGFLYGYRNICSVAESDEDVKAEFSFRQLDLILKALEMHVGSETQATRLYQQIERILRDINTELPKINELLNL